jgi:uncharacterized protein (TIGR03546 family)
MLKQLAKLLKALNAETAPWQISLAFILAMVMGFTPLLSLHNLLILLLALVLRVNLSAFILAWGVFSGLAFALDPLFIRTGEALLLHPELKGLWTTLYNNDLWRLAHFNHTLTLGSAVVATLLALPVFFIFRWLIIKYREKLLARVRRSRLMQLLKASRLYKLYHAVSEVREVV